MGITVTRDSEMRYKLCYIQVQFELKKYRETDTCRMKTMRRSTITYPFVLIYFLRLRGLTFEVFAFALAFFSAGGLSMISISESLTVDALRLPGCLLPTDDRSISGGSSDLEADPRVSDCCVGLCSRDDAAD